MLGAAVREVAPHRSNDAAVVQARVVPEVGVFHRQQGLLQGLAAAGVNLEYEKLDISESDELFERYGLLIPVLAFPGGKELCWPFSSEQVEQLLGG